MSKEKFDVEVLAGKLKSRFSVGDAGALTADADLFESTLPEGLSLDHVKEVQQHISNFVDASTLAFGRVSIDAFKADKALLDTETKFSVGNDKLRITTTRAAEVSDGKGGRMLKYGQTKPAYLVSGGSNVGSMKKVRATISAEAASALAD